MAWRQGHLVKFPWVPSSDDNSAVIRVMFNGFDRMGELVNCVAVRCLPTTPLDAVDPSSVSGKCCFGRPVLGVGVGIPDF